MTTQADWFTYRVADGVRVEPHREARRERSGARITTRRACRRPTARRAGPTGDRSVLLYDKYDIWEVRPDGTGARMVTGGEGRKQQIVFRYRSLDPEQKADPDRQAAAARRQRRPDRSERLLSRVG